MKGKSARAVTYILRDTVKILRLTKLPNLSDLPSFLDKRGASPSVGNVSLAREKNEMEDEDKKEEEREEKKMTLSGSSQSRKVPFARIYKESG